MIILDFIMIQKFYLQLFYYFEKGYFCLNKKKMVEIKPRIAIFASGYGSNAESIVQYFRNRDSASVDLIVSNNVNAYVLKRAEKLGISFYVINRTDFKQPENLIKLLEKNKIDFIVLAGFLWLIPLELISIFPQRIINIHPALLPKYGGKGMYGEHVHKAVSESGDIETGITIHYVNQDYDEGAIIFQKKIEIKAGEKPEMIAEKIHALEHAHFPIIIEKIIKSKS